MVKACSCEYFSREFNLRLLVFHQEEAHIFLLASLPFRLCGIGKALIKRNKFSSERNVQCLHLL